MAKGNGFKVFAGNSNPALVKEICGHLNIELGKAEIGTFPNGETRVELMESVRRQDVYVLQTTSPPVNDHIMELLLLFDALRRASARSVTAIIPYFGYSKQDKRKTGREPISAKVVANMLLSGGIDRLITVDLHAPQIEGFFNVPVDNLPTVSFFCKYYENNPPDVVVSPDAGRMKTVRNYARVLDCKVAVIDKYRPTYKGAKALHILGEVKGKDCLLIDDFIDTGGSITAAANAVLSHGAKSVSICATHSLLTDPAVERLTELGVEVVTTNTVAIPEEKRFNQLKILSIGPLLADVIRRIEQRESLSPLFEPVAF